MPKKIASAEERVEYALLLTENHQISEAQRVLRRIRRAKLSNRGLRMAAQAYFRCNRLEDVENCMWLLEIYGGIEPGDFFMLGSLQMRRSKYWHAAHHFYREIEIAIDTGMTDFKSSAAIRLASIMLEHRRFDEAKTALAIVNDGACEFIEGVGLTTKEDLLKQLQHARAIGNLCGPVIPWIYRN